MAQQHTVRDGEDMATIAKQYGFFWETLWMHASNQSLRERRDDPFALAPGDVVAIPEKTPKHAVGATGQIHRFRRLGATTELHIQLFKGDRPRAREAYQLDIDGIHWEGRTDAEGVLVEEIPVDAENGVLTIGPDAAVYELQLGRLPPLSEPEGMQARLNGLGFDCGREDGTIDDKTKHALKSFQRWCGLEPTGALDEVTQARLQTSYQDTGRFL